MQTWCPIISNTLVYVSKDKHIFVPNHRTGSQYTTDSYHLNYICHSKFSKCLSHALLKKVPFGTYFSSPQPLSILTHLVFHHLDILKITELFFFLILLSLWLSDIFSWYKLCIFVYITEVALFPPIHLTKGYSVLIYPITNDADIECLTRK